jgi:hypothetical protein
MKIFNFFNHYKIHHSFIYENNLSSDENFQRLIRHLNTPFEGISKLMRKYEKEKEKMEEENQNTNKNKSNHIINNCNDIHNKEEKLIGNDKDLNNNILQIKINDLNITNNELKNELNNLSQKFEILNKEYYRLINIEKEYNNLKKQVFNEDSKYNLLNNLNFFIENKFIEVAKYIQSINIDELNLYVNNIIDIESYSNKIKEDIYFSFEKYKKLFYDNIRKKILEINKNLKNEILKNDVIINKFESKMKNDSIEEKIIKVCLNPLENLNVDLNKKINDLENFDEKRYNTIFDLYLPFKLVDDNRENN